MRAVFSLAKPLLEIGVEDSIMLKPMPLAEAQSLPFWRRPVTLLFVMA